MSYSNDGSCLFSSLTAAHAGAHLEGCSTLSIDEDCVQEFRRSLNFAGRRVVDQFGLEWLPDPETSPGMEGGRPPPSNFEERFESFVTSKKTLGLLPDVSCGQRFPKGKSSRMESQ